MPLDLVQHWSAATPWQTFFRADMDHYQLWKGVYDRVILPGWALEGFMRWCATWSSGYWIGTAFPRR